MIYDFFINNQACRVRGRGCHHQCQMRELVVLGAASDDFDGDADEDDGDADEGGFEGICKLGRDQTAIGSSAKSAVSTLHPSLDYLDYEEDSFLIFPSKHTFNTNLTAVHHSVMLTTVSTSTIWCNIVGVDCDLRYNMERPVISS